MQTKGNCNGDFPYLVFLLLNHVQKVSLTMKITQKKFEYTFIAVYFKMNIFIQEKQIQLKTEKKYSDGINLIHNVCKYMYCC